MNADAATVALGDRFSGPGQMGLDRKMQSQHLGRQSLIYVRRSHPNQVQRHSESA